MSDSSEHTPSTPSIARSMILLAGFFFVLCAILYNGFLVTLAAKWAYSAGLRGNPEIPDAGMVPTMQIIFAAVGAVFILLAMAAGRIGSFQRFFKSPWTEKFVLAALVLIIPILTLELTLRPFAPRLSKSTSLFVRDDQLGWRMRPNTVETWGDVTVKTNAKGLRGPEVPYAKPPGSFRIMYLGDSVTFGFMLERYQDCFPFVTEEILQAETGREVETINAGIGGYSPWQEYAYLVDEGIRYEPDLVVISFVLNDVTEKFTLVRFGGKREGYQLSESYYSRFESLLARSSLVYHVRTATRKIKARRILGSDLQLGAIKRQLLNVETLMRQPDQENVQIAWRITLQNLQLIVDNSRERDVPVLLVASPFSVQLRHTDRLSAPQERLARYAADNAIPFVDLLPGLSACVAEDSLSPADIFFDHDHFTVRGSKLAAEMIARKILEMNLIEK